MLKTVKMDLEFLPYLAEAPMNPAQFQDRATANDAPTITAWRDIWIKNAQYNHDNYGPFSENHVGQLFGACAQKPCIVLGSGPSLSNSIEALKKNKSIYVVSCLHNFHYLIDNDIKVDLWVSLDAGPVTLEEISEGGKHPHEYYLEKSQDQTLAAYVSTDKGLVESWQGRILWFTCGIPDEGIKESMEKIEKFEVLVSSGGNVLGASIYIAKSFLGANPVGLGGADFSFSYDKKFHAWDSKYDGKLGKAMFAHDVFGNKVYTWLSYNNFKCWTEGISIRCPGTWINCSEGGTLGSYHNGLIPSIKQMTMWDFIRMYEIHEEMRYMAHNPTDATEPGDPGPKILF